MSKYSRLEAYDQKKIHDDYTIDQEWDTFTDTEHETWRLLYERQKELLPGRACDEFIEGMEQLGIAADGIPRFDDLNQILGAKTGWEVVAVPGLIPDEPFFDLLANRKFPSGNFIRKREQLDYIQEPDVFHDVFGHVPLLMNPIFADYIQAYGKGGHKALRHGAVHKLARLYWYTVEFGLIDTEEGLRIFGAGILSSPGEAVFCLEDTSPNRIKFDLERLMRTDYRIDDYQEVYFVIDSFEQLFEETYKDFNPVYEELAKDEISFKPFDLLKADQVLHYGTGIYAMQQKAANDKTK